MLKSETYRAGFSLLELLIVLFVIGMVIMLLLPAARKSKEEADAIQCIGNLKHIGISLVNCSDTNKGLMPPVLGLTLMIRHSARFSITSCLICNRKTCTTKVLMEKTPPIGTRSVCKAHTLF